jgi:DNA-binding LacI/PurR family transcriptional regulator
MRPDTLTQKFVEDVIRDIRDRRLKGHDLFEGQVELGKKFGVSYTVVRKGLKRLIDQRLIYRIKGKGTYIAPREHFAINYVLVMVNPTKIRLLPDVLQQLTMCLRSEFISRSQLMMTFMASEDLVDVRKMCYEDQVRGVFFLDINRSIPYVRDIEAFFKKRNIPIIYYEEKINVQNINTISLDHKLAGAMCANHLIERGCRRIGMITDRNKGILMGRVEGFLEEAKKITGVKADVIHVTTSPWITEDVLRNYDGMAVLYEGLAYVAMAIMQRYKVRYPADIALVGIDGSEVAKHSKPSLTTVTQPIKEMARIGVEKIYAMMEDPSLKFEHIKVAPILEPRKST